jgi:hypothetical protein
MLWFFERNDESIKLETLFDNTKAEYVATVKHPDGHEDVERFTDGDAFRVWLERFEHDLEIQHWAPRGRGPVILPYGWPEKNPANKT